MCRFLVEVLPMLLAMFLRASVWSASITYIFFAINFLGQLILARFVSPEDFGIYAFIVAISEISTIFFGFSNSSSFIYTDGTQLDYNAAYRLNFIVSILLLLSGVVGFFPLYVLYSKKSAVLFLLLCITQCFTRYGGLFLAPLEKKLDYKKFSLLNGISSSAGILLAIFAAIILQADIWSLAIREMVSGIFVFLFGLAFGKMKYNNVPTSFSIKNQFFFGIRTSVSGALEILFHKIPDLLIGRQLGVSALGNFDRSRNLAYLLIRSTTPFTEKVLFSFLTNIRNDKFKIRCCLFWLNFLVIRVWLPILLVIHLYGQEIFVYIYGPQWFLAGRYFQCFVLFVLFGSLLNVVQFACYGLAKQKYVSQAYLLAIIFFVFGGRHLITEPQYAALMFSLGCMAGYIYLMIRLQIDYSSLGLARIFFPPLFWISGVLAMQYIGISREKLFIASCLLLLCLYGFEHKFLKMVMQRVSDLFTHSLHSSLSAEASIRMIKNLTVHLSKNTGLQAQRKLGPK